MLRNIGLTCIALGLALPQARVAGANIAAWSHGLVAGVAFFAVYEAMNTLWSIGSTVGDGNRRRGTRAVATVAAEVR